jgi:hypothetical protein
MRDVTEFCKFETWDVISVYKTMQSQVVSPLGYTSRIILLFTYL